MKKKRKLENRLARHRKLYLIGLISGILLVGFIAYNLVVGILTPFHAVKAGEKTEASISENDYLSILKDGDEFMNLHQWYNAAFEYRRAIELKPNGEIALYRLTWATIMLCEKEGEGCAEVPSLLKSLEKSNYDVEQVEGLQLRWEAVRRNR